MHGVKPGMDASHATVKPMRRGSGDAKWGAVAPLEMGPRSASRRLSGGLVVPVNGIQEAMSLAVVGGGRVPGQVMRAALPPAGAPPRAPSPQLQFRLEPLGRSPSPVPPS